MVDDPIITIADIRSTGHCTRGTRRWFEAHGLDFSNFLQNGISESKLLARGDALALAVVQKTRERRNG